MDVSNEIIFWAKKLYERGYVCGLGGNLSVKIGNFVFIKKSGRSLGFLSKDDITKVNIQGFSDDASIDLRIHQEIYNNSSSLAIMHAHPPYTIVISLYLNDVFEPIDFEGKYYLEKIPIISGKHSTIYRKLGQLAKDYNVIIERGHGVYVHDKSLKDCFNLIEMLELSAKIQYLYLLISR